MFSFSSKNKEEVVALFDISSGSVGGAMILNSENGVPTIISSFRKNFKLKEEQNTNLANKEILISLTEVASTIQKSVHRSPDKVYAVISSPFVKSSLKKIKHKAPESFLFTEKFAKDLVKNELEKFKTENNDFEEVVDKRITNILLNGYEIKKPNGKRAKECEIDVFLSLADPLVLEKIEDVISKIYHKDVKFASNIFANFVVVRDILDTLNDFITIDVGEEVTEVSVMREDNLLEVGYMPFGKNTFIRYLSKEIKRDIGDTFSLITLYKKGHLHDANVAKIEKSVREVNKSWINSLKKTLRDLLFDTLIPPNIFLICDKDSENFYKNLLSVGNFPEFTTTNDSFNVIIPSDNILRDFYKISLGTKKDKDLIIKSIFIANIERVK
jgi:hypothetical protein